MVVLDGEDFDGGYLAPIEPAVGVAGDWVMGRLENQAIGVIEVAGELPAPVGELVIPGLRKISHVFESSGGTEFLESFFKFFGT